MKQDVKTNDPDHFFQILLSGVLPGSILGLILYNIFLNKLVNFVDDNVIYAGK